MLFIFSKQHKTSNFRQNLHQKQCGNVKTWVKRYNLIKDLMNLSGLFHIWLSNVLCHAPKKVTIFRCKSFQHFESSSFVQNVLQTFSVLKICVCYFLVKRYWGKVLADHKMLAKLNTDGVSSQKSICCQAKWEQCQKLEWQLLSDCQSCVIDGWRASWSPCLWWS